MASALDLLMNTKEDVNLLSEESDICTIDAKTRVLIVTGKQIGRAHV